jgi:mono/diheme cytochrome c family protein
MHRLAPLALTLALGLAAGCGGSSSSSSSSQTQSTSSGASGASAAQGDATAGKAIFASSCKRCHALAAANATGTIGPDLDSLKPDFAAVKNQVVNGGGAMPAFGRQKILDAKQIDDVAAYVSSVAGK